MTNIIFYTLLLSISTSFGLGAMKYSTINRTFMLLQRSVFEYAVITIDENNYPYYDEQLIKEGIDNYFENNIKPIVNKYTTGIIFLNDNNSLCVNGKCQRVQVSLKANINYLFNFEKSMTFTITSLMENNHE
ncbi:MAG: hypothetical protein PUG55_06065 [Bacillales bacterium]|nr:hypothetical protein [Bacillales bacterium]